MVFVCTVEIRITTLDHARRSNAIAKNTLTKDFERSRSSEDLTRVGADSASTVSNLSFVSLRHLRRTAPVCTTNPNLRSISLVKCMHSLSLSSLTAVKIHLYSCCLSLAAFMAPANILFPTSRGTRPLSRSIFRLLASTDPSRAIGGAGYQ